MPPTPEQERELRELLNAIGIVPAMRLVADWFKGQTTTGSHGPEFKDRVEQTVSGLYDTASYLQGIRG